jgi:hypothetical protein
MVRSSTFSTALASHRAVAILGEPSSFLSPVSTSFSMKPWRSARTEEPTLGSSQRSMFQMT